MVNNSALIAEFIGTFLLAFTIQSNTKYFEGTQSNNPFIIMGGFFIAISLTREISGGHINPAVTLSLYLKDVNLSVKNTYLNIGYIISQCLGALVAALFGNTINNNIFKLSINNDCSVISAFIAETIGSALFYTVILIQSDNIRNKLYTDKSMSTLIITSGLGCGCALAGNISGAGLNPAIAFGFNIGRLIIKGNISELKYLWLYILAPCIGAYISNWIYFNIYNKYMQIIEEDKKKELNINTKEKVYNNINSNTIVNKKENKQGIKIELKTFTN